MRRSTRISATGDMSREGWAWHEEVSEWMKETEDLSDASDTSDGLEGMAGIGGSNKQAYAGPCGESTFAKHSADHHGVLVRERCEEDDRESALARREGAAGRGHSRGLDPAEDGCRLVYEALGMR